MAIDRAHSKNQSTASQDKALLDQEKSPSRIAAKPIIFASIDPVFTKHPDFLVSLSDAAHRAGHALSFAESIQVARTWNSQHADDPVRRVVVSEVEFFKLALRNPYPAHGDQPRLSPTVLTYLESGKFPEGLSNDQKKTVRDGKVSAWEKHWDKLNLPFSFESFSKAINTFSGNAVVQTHDAVAQATGRNFYSLAAAIALVARRTGTSGQPSASISPEAAERVSNGEDYQPIGQANWEQRTKKIATRLQENAAVIGAWEKAHGRKPTSEESKHILLGSGFDDLIRSVGTTPAAAYRKLTGLSPTDAPYAYAALDFIGGAVASPLSIGKQAGLALNNPLLYCKDVILNSPETAAIFMQSLNVFDSSISGPERFKRLLNVAALVTSAKSITTLAKTLKDPAIVREAIKDVVPPRPRNVSGFRHPERGAVQLPTKPPIVEQIRYCQEAAVALKKRASTLSEYPDQRVLLKRAHDFQKDAERLQRQLETRGVKPVSKDVSLGEKKALELLPHKKIQEARRLLMKNPVTFGEFKKAIELLGFEPPSGKGSGSSHVSWKHPDGRVTTLSGHADGDTIPVGTKNKMLHDIRWK